MRYPLLMESKARSQQSFLASPTLRCFILGLQARRRAAARLQHECAQQAESRCSPIGSDWGYTGLLRIRTSGNCHGSEVRTQTVFISAMVWQPPSYPQSNLDPLMEPLQLFRLRLLDPHLRLLIFGPSLLLPHMCIGIFKALPIFS